MLTAIDVFVLPSTAVESFSNAALEAMAIGRPVILSDIGGAREMIDDGVEGYVVSPTELAGATAGTDRGAVCRPAQASADGAGRARAVRKPASRSAAMVAAIAHCSAENLHDTRPSATARDHAPLLVPTLQPAVAAHAARHRRRCAP